MDGVLVEGMHPAAGRRLRLHHAMQACPKSAFLLRPAGRGVAPLTNCLFDVDGWVRLSSTIEGYSASMIRPASLVMAPRRLGFVVYGAIHVARSAGLVALDV